MISARSGISSICYRKAPPAGRRSSVIPDSLIEREPSNLIAGVSGGWPKVISNPKSLLETGFAVLKDPYPKGNQR
jgi:hypothetical protein